MRKRLIAIAIAAVIAAPISVHAEYLCEGGVVGIVIVPDKSSYSQMTIHTSGAISHGVLGGGSIGIGKEYRA